ncbi:hypothetical protein GJ699_26985 [Duganella sp. FT80W]|uniref:Uncharacterized protein n=1 Tax=Duganella guangzhouensis TaxID=2666084 RepID=A0A6I2LA08_9BURK|nr:hypothetical protein [Duganella guangzhouensis]MRW93644.1 hypothetical protein [Duganella guangzhouensis]
MNTPIINLVLLKRFVTNEPSVFDDTVYSVRYHLQQAGFEVLVSCNVIAPDALNIIWGVGTWGSPTLEQMRQLAKPEYSIIFNMEQLGSDSALVTDEYLQFLSEYRVFDYNQHNIDALQARFPTPSARNSRYCRPPPSPATLPSTGRKPINAPTWRSGARTTTVA